MAAVFPPAPDSEPVQKLREALHVDEAAREVTVNVLPGARPRNCFENVLEMVKQKGSGAMLLGWAVWQHQHLYVEAERHAVFDPGGDAAWIDCTPPSSGLHSKVTFIPDRSGTYDITTTDLVDNVRMPLIDDPRLRKLLKLFAKKTELYNSVPGVNVPLPPDIRDKVLEVEFEAVQLEDALMNGGDDAAPYDEFPAPPAPLDENEKQRLANRRKRERKKRRR